MIRSVVSGGLFSEKKSLFSLRDLYLYRGWQYFELYFIMAKISAVIITFNEEKNIGRCIDSLTGLVDEIVVLDSFSKDDTKKIALERAVKFYENVFEGHIQQKNKAVSLASYDYVLSLDADEYLSEELRNAIAGIKQNPLYQAYSMNRLSSFKGRWIRATDWYPDKKIRLWNRAIGHWGGNNPHDTVIVNRGITVKHLRGDLLHAAYDGIEPLFQKAYSYALIYARDKGGRRGITAFTIFYKTFFSFFRNFILKLGFTCGYDGFLISCAAAIYTFYKYSLLREYNIQRKHELL